MKRTLMPIAAGLEEVKAIRTIDLLHRAEIKIITAVLTARQIYQYDLILRVALNRLNDFASGATGCSPHGKFTNLA